MTFEQALEKRKSINYEKVIINGMICNVYVTPNNKSDFECYIRYIRKYFYRLKDEDAKYYSTDGLFAVYELHSDGFYIGFKRLSI